MKKILKGHARTLPVGDNVNTDYIISGRYKFRIQDPRELATHVFEDIDPAFAKRVTPGDFVIAGQNFGCGSSREQAPQALKAAGLSAVLAKSFARIFYRNAFNIGFPLFVCDTTAFAEGDELVLDMNAGEITNATQKTTVKTTPLPEIVQAFLDEGGVIEYFKKHGGLTLAGGTQKR